MELDLSVSPSKKSTLIFSTVDSTSSHSLLQSLSSPNTTHTLIMWPFDSYPEVSPSQIDGNEYDYIVVGGKIDILFTMPQ